MNFIPQIVNDREADSQREADKAVRRAMTEALGIKAVAEAIAPYKTDGIVTGNKVLDDDRAVAALIKTAPEHLRGTINAQKLRPFRLTQLLNQVLRKEFEMVKGKLTGNASPRKVALLAAKQSATV